MKFSGTREQIRQHADPASKPICEETYAYLLEALETVYPGKWRRKVEVCHVAVVKIIDNEADALETIRRIENRRSDDEKSG